MCKKDKNNKKKDTEINYEVIEIFYVRDNGGLK